jgi:hypothetical protein
MQMVLFLPPSGITPSELAKTGYTLAAIDLGIHPGGARMIRLRVLLLTAIVLAFVAQLQAGPQPAVDPRLIVNNTHVPVSSCTSLTMLSFDFMANPSGGGMFCFTNDSTEAWTFFEIDTPAFDPTDVITCGGTSFETCVVLRQPGDFAVIDFSGGPGIGIGDSFTIDLGASGWPPNGEFHAVANPEPSSLALSFAGLVPLLGRRIRHLRVLIRRG